MNNVSVIIPAYKPDEKLLKTLRELVDAGFSDLLVVDDGSGSEYLPIFQEVETIPQCTLLRHPVNKGKGAGLKTAMNYFLENRPEGAGVVTADADGQHLTKDILAVAKAVVESGKVIIGARDFSGDDVPARSKAGNRITIGVFRLFFGMKIGDTQTGLRGFPRSYIPQILEAEGDRYEFETHMLILMSKKKIPFDEVKISTVYIEENQSSHFRVVRDSIRIYSLILKYLLSSAAASIIDAGAFFFIKLLFGAVMAVGPVPVTFIAAFFARVISSLVNFFINAKVVFGGKADKKAMARYYILAAAQICVSALLVYLTEQVLSIVSPALSTLVKIIVDTILFFFSFRIQHKWVFNDEEA